MDYHDSSAGNARLAVIKYPATAEKLGTVFFNPGHPLRFLARSSPLICFMAGGPGGSGVQAIAQIGLPFYEALRGAYDIVSWDPRGVGYTLYVHISASMRFANRASSQALENFIASIPLRKRRHSGRAR